MRGIIIGAGRGIRLMPTTANTPKCYAEIGGRRILEWILDAFREGGVSDVCFIGGYLIDVVRRDYPHFTFRYNEDWENNNILESLMYAEDLMDEPFVITYADILYSGQAVRSLVESPHDIALLVDTLWADRYDGRTEHPPHDAEKVTAEDGRLTRVHRGIDPGKAYGEYTGVAKFSRRGAGLLKEHYHRCRGQYAGRPFRDAPVFEKAYLIQLFQEMIEAGVAMTHVDTPGDYWEIDTQQDFDMARSSWQVRP